jgi:hypothetical protein
MTDGRSLNPGAVGNGAGDTRLRAPKLLSFDVFGTLVDVRDGSYGAFASILSDSGGSHIDVKHFWEFWEERSIAHYWEPTAHTKRFASTRWQTRSPSPGQV